MELSRREALLGMVGMAATLAVPKLAVGDSARSTATWNELAKHFLIDPNITYLNSGSLGATPRVVLDIIAEETRLLERNPTANQYDLFPRKAFAVKQALARFLGCRDSELVMTGGTTDGMALLMEALPLKAGQRVLITDQEYGRIRDYWDYYCKRSGAALDIVALPLLPRDAAEITRLIRAAIRPETRAICLSHVTTANGVCLPVQEISAVARRHGCLLLVDGAQAVGAMPVDVGSLGCDAYAASGHKWLLGPKGTGFLYVAGDAKQAFSSPKLDLGYGEQANFISIQSLPNIMGLGAALDWLGKLGHAVIYARLGELRATLHDRLASLKSLEMLSPPPGSSLASPIVAVRLRDPSLREKVEKDLVGQGIMVKSLHGQYGVDLRVGGHVYNNEKDVVRLIDFLTRCC